MVTLWSSFLTFLIVLLCLFFGLLVYFKNRKRIDHQYFFILSLFTAIFVGSAYLSEFFPKTHPFLAIILSRITYASVIWWAMFLSLFSIVFPEGRKLSLKLILPLFFFGIFTSILVLCTPFIIERIKLQPWGFDVVYGKLFYPFFLPTTFLLFIPFPLVLLKKYKKLESVQKIQLKYFFTGLGIFCSLLIFFNVILPFIIGTQQYYFLGNYSAIFFLGFTAYSIVARHLFGIEVILTEIFVGLIGLLLVVQIFTTPTILWKVINGIIFILFCFFSYLLIRSVLREIKIREEVERVSRMKSEFIAIASHQLRTF